MPLYYQQQILFLLLLVPVLLAIFALNGALAWPWALPMAVFILRFKDWGNEMDRVRLAQHRAGEIR